MAWFTYQNTNQQHHSYIFTHHNSELFKYLLDKNNINSQK